MFKRSYDGKSTMALSVDEAELSFDDEEASTDEEDDSKQLKEALDLDSYSQRVLAACQEYNLPDLEKLLGEGKKQLFCQALLKQYEIKTSKPYKLYNDLSPISYQANGMHYLWLNYEPDSRQKFIAIIKTCITKAELLQLLLAPFKQNDSFLEYLAKSNAHSLMIAIEFVKKMQQKAINNDEIILPEISGKDIDKISREALTKIFSLLLIYPVEEKIKFILSPCVYCDKKYQNMLQLICEEKLSLNENVLKELFLPFFEENSTKEFLELTEKNSSYEGVLYYLAKYPSYYLANNFIEYFKDQQTFTGILTAVYSHQLNIFHIVIQNENVTVFKLLLNHINDKDQLEDLLLQTNKNSETPVNLLTGLYSQKDPAYRDFYNLLQARLPALTSKHLPQPIVTMPGKKEMDALLESFLKLNVNFPESSQDEEADNYKRKRMVNGL